MSKDLKITGKEVEEYSCNFDVLSDMDFGRNSETGEYDVPAVEWDGPYGKHWVHFENEEAREERLLRYQAHMNEWVVNFREENRIREEKRIAKIREIENSKTLGGMFPELELLKLKLS